MSADVSCLLLVLYLIGKEAILLLKQIKCKLLIKTLVETSIYFNNDGENDRDVFP